MVRYYLTTNPLRPIGMLPLALSLLSHGRLSLKSAKAHAGGDQTADGHLG